MPFIATKNDHIKSMSGIHLFHFSTSNCSQRVRFVLEEKGIKWVSHHIDLRKCENATPEFVAINPKGVVPVLIHDGKTLTESNDIIQYLEQNFDGTTLEPQSVADKDYLDKSLQRSSDYQSSFKLLMHEFLFKPVRRMNEQELAEYNKGTINQELSDFMREFSSKSGFSQTKITAAIQDTENVLQELDNRLKSSPWLTGENFGLTDISWAVNIHRLSHMHYPMTSYPSVRKWLAKVRRRPAFKKSISQYEPKKMLIIFNIYTCIRYLKGSSVRQMLLAAPSG